MATEEMGQSRRRTRDQKSEGQTAESSTWNDQFSAGSSTEPGGQGSTSGGASGRKIGDELRQLVRDRTYEQIDTQKERATANLGTLAGAVRGMTRQLRDNDQARLADYVTRAADELDRWSSRIKDQDLDGAVRDVQSFARRRPAVFIGVAFGAGLLVARFLKSSGDDDEPHMAAAPSWQPASSMAVERPSVAHDMPGATPGTAFGSSSAKEF